MRGVQGAYTKSGSVDGWMWGGLLGSAMVNGNNHDDDRPASSNDARSESTLSSDAGLGISSHESGEEGPAVGIGVGANMDLELLARGSTFGRYTVLERLGAGAMGVVYAAYDPELDRKIALKLLRPQQSEGDQTRRQARMVREAQAIAKVSHTNVVGIFEIGVHEGHVFMAMEHLAGGTLRDWVAAKKPTWREIVRVYIEVGRGLAAAHAEGLIHRDFKPDNVLLDKNGVPKVVDFGLVRLAARGADLTSSNAIDREEVTTTPEVAPYLLELPGGAAALTRTGALTGTPAYMAPEQFMGQKVDERSDQFAFCVALFEALYGERPFAGANVIQLADSVTSGRVREVPKNIEVPTWVRRAVLRGLAADPAARMASIADLIATLERDPIASRRRNAAIASAVLVLAGTVVGAREVAVRRRQQLDKQIASLVQDGEAALSSTNALEAQFVESRAQAFAAFDSMSRDAGERAWQRALTIASTLDAADMRAEQALQGALTLDKSRPLTRQLLVTVLGRRATLAETLGRHVDSERFASALAELDPGSNLARQWHAPAVVLVKVSPSGSNLSLDRYEQGLGGGRSPVRQAAALGSHEEVSLAPGSYRLNARKDGVDVHYPFILGPGEHKVLSFRVPKPLEIPDGFVYVPAGSFLFGEADESMRSSFLDTVPIHETTTSAFLVARLETTYADWIAYLESLPPVERRQHTPRIANSREGRNQAPGELELREVGPKDWQLDLRPSGVRFTARSGEPLVYPNRTKRRSQNWLRFPVAGISAIDAEGYTHWLATSGRIPLARLCTEKEWERVARGADDRIFPNGNYLADDDANIDTTYGRQSASFGPDEVGSHPASASPFGVHDLAGNVLEMTHSSLEKGGVVARGGGYYHDRRSAWITNRAALEPRTRLHTFGLRICADVTN